MSVLVGFCVVSSCAKDKVVSNPVVNCTDSVYFSAQITPMIQDNCLNCHNTGGTLPILTNHSEISSNASAVLNTLYGTPQLMPQGGPALNDTLIQQFACWIEQGKKNN